MLNEIMSAIFSVAVLMGQVGTQEYPNEVLTGASEIVNRAIASDGKTSVPELKGKLEAYMADKGVKMPAAFKDQNGDRIVLYALLVRDRKDDGQDLVATFTSSASNELRNWVIYSTKPGKPL